MPCVEGDEKDDECPLIGVQCFTLYLAYGSSHVLLASRKVEYSGSLRTNDALDS